MFNGPSLRTAGMDAAITNDSGTDSAIASSLNVLFGRSFSSPGSTTSPCSHRSMLSLATPGASITGTASSYDPSEFDSVAAVSTPVPSGFLLSSAAPTSSGRDSRYGKDNGSDRAVWTADDAIHTCFSPGTTPNSTSGSRLEALKEGQDKAASSDTEATLAAEMTVEHQGRPGASKIGSGWNAGLFDSGVWKRCWGSDEEDDDEIASDATRRSGLGGSLNDGGDHAASAASDPTSSGNLRIVRRTLDSRREWGSGEGAVRERNAWGAPPGVLAAGRRGSGDREAAETSPVPALTTSGVAKTSDDFPAATDETASTGVKPTRMVANSMTMPAALRPASPLLSSADGKGEVAQETTVVADVGISRDNGLDMPSVATSDALQKGEHRTTCTGA